MERSNNSLECHVLELAETNENVNYMGKNVQY